MNKNDLNAFAGTIKRAGVTIYWAGPKLACSYEFLFFERPGTTHWSWDADFQALLRRAFKEIGDTAPDRALWWKRLIGDVAGIRHIPLRLRVEEYPYADETKLSLRFIREYRGEFLGT